eukprot:CAMPEP_0113529038 /NCGR_PEP_ID=MMETSP0015_2-20120614/2172_1 /TAXON_ID=2838 /ORGANISM="Odontella" /LENGTH=100 /DNA_ID=CAMNT_0000427625 /DNA_START=375 /DNA_END=674 /DNA_ORIENTATION=+ /assembly_acc=CAM_ASM_000160
MAPSNDYGSTTTGAVDDDPESFSPSESRPLVRRAFSTDVGGGDHYPSPPYPPRYCSRMNLLSAYVLACTLLFGICLGVTGSFYISGRYFRTPRGLTELGC